MTTLRALRLADSFLPQEEWHGVGLPHSCPSPQEGRFGDHIPLVSEEHSVWRWNLQASSRTIQKDVSHDWHPKGCLCTSGPWFSVCGQWVVVIFIFLSILSDHAEDWLEPHLPHLIPSFGPVFRMLRLRGVQPLLCLSPVQVLLVQVVHFRCSGLWRPTHLLSPLFCLRKKSLFSSIRELVCTGCGVLSFVFNLSRFAWCLQS